MEAAEVGLSLMLCSPLMPQRDSLVEVAETECVSFREADWKTPESHRSPFYQGHTADDIDERDEPEDSEGFPTESNTADGDQPPDTSGIEPMGVFRYLWPETEGEKRAEPKVKKQADTEGREFKTKEKLVWVPSPTKLSLQTMWWGYKMSVGF